MRSKHVKKTLMISASILLIGVAVAYAHGGYGRHWDGYAGHMMGYRGGHMMDWEGCGPHRYGYGRGQRFGADLSKEEAARIDAARDKFFEETASLREQINEKRFALRNEMVKDEPDTAAAAKLQKELSALEAEFDQKTLQHRLEMRKLWPEKARGRWHGRGYGPGCW